MTPIVGIDLGTTNSLVAVMEDGRPKAIPLEASPLLPSVVSILGSSVEVGAEARRKRILQGRETAFSFKRFMGRGIGDLSGELGLLPFEFDGSSQKVIRLLLGGKAYTPIELSAMILLTLKKGASKYLGTEVTKAVVTVPAYFDDAQRQATKLAGELAGLEVVRILNEPTAAALAYGFTRPDEERRRRVEKVVAVYDLGGGTFDISILRIKEGIFQVLSTCGNTRLGGDDLDEALMNLFAGEIGKEIDLPLLHRLREEAENAKCALSLGENVSVSIPLDGGKAYKRELSRGEFERLILPFIERTLPPCRQAIQDSHLPLEEIDEVLLVGGSTRIPLVRKKVEEVFQRVPRCDLDPDLAVAMGAAIQADILQGRTRDMLLLDVTPLSLGIETYGGLMTVLIPRNTPIPVSVSEEFTTFVHGQTGIALQILQGERELAKDNRSLGKFDLRGIPPLPSGVPRIVVTFLIDADGILVVSARDQKTGKETSATVTPSHGLTREEVSRMVSESLQFAEEDVKVKMLISARNEATLLLKAVREALEKDEDLLTPEESAAIRGGVRHLEEVMESEDHRPIVQKVRILNEKSREFAERRMNRVLRETLVNRSVEKRVTFLPLNKIVDLEGIGQGAGVGDDGRRGVPPHGYSGHGLPGSILDIALASDVTMEHACGGNCACTTCHVYVQEGMENLSEPTEQEEYMLDRAWCLKMNSRLACQARVLRGVVVVEIPEQSVNVDVRKLEGQAG